MPADDRIEVQILCNKQPLQEYPVPVGETAPDNNNVRYIEAIAGERFEVKVRYQAGFQLKGAVNIMSTLQLDGQEWLGTPILCKSLTIRNGALSFPFEQAHGSCRVNVTKTLAQISYYTFGALELIEMNDKKVTYNQDKLDCLGEIKVTVYRGSPSTVVEPQVSTPVEVYEKVPAKGLKGRLLKNNVRYDDGFHGETRPVNTCAPLPGKAGQKTVFIFRYRSKEILKQLGCIERTPSPPPDHTLLLERQEEMIREAKERARRANLEILELRQQLAQGDEPRGVKREREADADDDEIKEMAPPPKKILVVVDLTEDDD